MPPTLPPETPLTPHLPKYRQIQRFKLALETQGASILTPPVTLQHTLMRMQAHPETMAYITEIAPLDQTSGFEVVYGEGWRAEWAAKKGSFTTTFTNVVKEVAAEKMRVKEEERKKMEGGDDGNGETGKDGEGKEGAAEMVQLPPAPAPVQPPIFTTPPVPAPVQLPPPTTAAVQPSIFTPAPIQAPIFTSAPGIENQPVTNPPAAFTPAPASLAARPEPAQTPAVPAPIQNAAPIVQNTTVQPFSTFSTWTPSSHRPSGIPDSFTFQPLVVPESTTPEGSPPITSLPGPARPFAKLRPTLTSPPPRTVSISETSLDSLSIQGERGSESPVVQQTVFRAPLFKPLHRPGQPGQEARQTMPVLNAPAVQQAPGLPQLMQRGRPGQLVQGGSLGQVTATQAVQLGRQMSAVPQSQVSLFTQPTRQVQTAQQMPAVPQTSSVQQVQPVQPIQALPQPQTAQYTQPAQVQPVQQTPAIAQPQYSQYTQSSQQVQVQATAQPGSSSQSVQPIQNPPVPTPSVQQVQPQATQQGAPRPAASAERQHLRDWYRQWSASHNARVEEEKGGKQ